MSIAKELDLVRKSFRWDDMSLWFLLFSNIITIYFAVTQNWDLLTVMWIYWFQSVIIGIFNFIRILKLKDFYSDNLTDSRGNKIIEPTEGGKNLVAFMFIVHFGFFHFVYWLFIFGLTYEDWKEAVNSPIFDYILLSVFAFFMAHALSFFNSRKIDETKKQDIGLIMMYPYARIIPMHFTILFGFFINYWLLFFLVLKTIADVIMHVRDEKLSRK